MHLCSIRLGDLPAGAALRTCRGALRAAVWAALLAAGLASGARAAASLPWTPDAFTRHQIQWLVDDAGLQLPVSQWPLPRNAVFEALDHLRPGLSPAQEAARLRVRAALIGDAGLSADLTLRGPQEGLAGFGEDALPGISLSLRSPAYEGGVVAAQLGVRLGRTDPGDTGQVDLRFEGSGAATELFGVQLQAWSRRSWWSPGWQSSLVLGNNAPALSGVSLQRALASTSDSRWLSWMGPWNFEFFVAQLDDVSQPANPFLIGNRLSLRPFPGLEIGLTRTAQWGGRGRDQSFKSFIKTLTGTGTNATAADAQAGIDPASQLAGFDFRLRCGASWRCAGYMQLMGEDLAGGLPSRYLGLYGMEAWSADGRHRWIAELAETGCRMPIGQPVFKGCAYRNYVYPEGYVSAHRWLGAGVGPESRVLTLGWLDAASQRSLRLHYGTIGSRLGRYSPQGDDPRHAGHLIGIGARQTWRWGHLSIEPELSWLRVSAALGSQVEARAGVTMRLQIP